MSDTTKSTNEHGFSLAAIQRGFTEAFLVKHVGNAVTSVWATIAFIAAHLADGLTRDAILARLFAAGFSAQAVGDVIGTSEGGFSQRKGAIDALRHAGVNLDNASAFSDKETVKRLQRVSWRAAYDGREVVMAAPEGDAAWQSLLAFTDANRPTREAMISEARGVVAEAAQAAVKALPDDAPTAEREAAEKAAQTASERADKARERAAKVAAQANAKATGRGGTARGSRTAPELTVAFSKDAHTALFEALEGFNAEYRGKGKGRPATFEEFIVHSVAVAHSHGYQERADAQADAA